MHLEVTSRKQWRDWLRKNHKKESKVYLIKYKKHTGKGLNNKEAMEEAICFGWIDTTVKRLDEDRYQQCFMKRTPKSRWSKNTLRYAEELIGKGLMSKEGLRAYEEGKKKPTIDHEVPKEVPKDLKKALVAAKKWKAFEALAPSRKRYALIRYITAKQEETKAKRVKEILASLK